MSALDPAVLHKIVKAYDIRGRVADELTVPVMYAFGLAAADVLEPGHTPIAVGHDMRTSSPALADAFCRGVQDAGRDVIDLGLVSTDMVWFASGALMVPGAMITASHNPPTDNGVKLCGVRAKPVSITTGLADLRDRALQPQLPVSRPTAGVRRTESIARRFAQHVAAVTGFDRHVPAPVVVDAGNGMGGLVWPLVAEELDIPTDPLFFALDGTFPNHPANPLEKANLAWLSQRVRETNAVVGFAFDGDADRVFAVDEHGEPVSASAMGAVLATWQLAQHPGATVLANAITSRCVVDAVTAHGGQLERTRVGHSFIKQDMARTGAVYACEHSGHHYFAANYGADSGVIAAVMFLQALLASGQSASELLAPYRRDVSLGEESYTVSDPMTALDAVAEAFSTDAHITMLDGVTATFENGWLNVRPSNTEPVVRVNVEADDAQTVERLRKQTLDAMVNAGCLHLPQGGHHA